jgi:hypothetical protein
MGKNRQKPIEVSLEEQKWIAQQTLAQEPKSVLDDKLGELSPRPAKADFAQGATAARVAEGLEAAEDMVDANEAARRAFLQQHGTLIARSN